MEILPAGQAVGSCGNAAVHRIGIAASTGLDGFRIDNGIPNLPIRTPFQEEYRTGQGIAQGIDFLNVDFTGPEGIGKGNRSRCTGSHHHRLRILAVAEVQGILGDDFLHRIGSGSQLTGEDNAVLTCGKGRAGNLLPGGIRYPEHPASGGSAVCHGFDNLQSAVLGIGVGKGCVLTGCDSGVLFYIHIVFPVMIHPLVVEFSDRVVSGEQLATSGRAVRAGGDGFNPGISLPDFKVPTLCTSVNSIFLYHNSAVLDVGVGQVGVLTCYDGGVLFHIHIVFPVTIHPLVVKFSDRVVSGEQLATSGCAVRAGGDGFNPGIALPDFKVPTLGTSVNSIFLYHNSAVLDVGVGQVGVLTGCDGGVLFHIHIVFPVTVHPLVVKLSDRVVSGEQLATSGRAVRAGGDGFNPGISLPDFKVPPLCTSVDGVLLYHNSAPVDIGYGDSCGLTCNHRNGVTGGVQLPVGVTASNFTDNVLPGRKIGGSGQALGIGGNGLHNLICSGIHDFKLPSGEVLPGVGGFLHLDLAFQLHSQTEAAGNRIYRAVQYYQLLTSVGAGLVLVDGTGFGSLTQLMSTGTDDQLIQLPRSSFRGRHLQGVSAPGKG